MKGTPVQRGPSCPKVDLLFCVQPNRLNAGRVEPHCGVEPDLAIPASKSTTGSTQALAPMRRIQMNDSLRVHPTTINNLLEGLSVRARKNGPPLTSPRATSSAIPWMTRSRLSKKDRSNGDPGTWMVLIPSIVTTSRQLSRCWTCSTYRPSQLSTPGSDHFCSCPVLPSHRECSRAKSRFRSLSLPQTQFQPKDQMKTTRPLATMRSHRGFCLPSSGTRSATLT